MIRNLGPRSTAWLRDAGIDSLEQLRKLGPEVAYWKIRALGHPATKNLLWGLVAACLDKDWRELTAAEKQHAQARLAALSDPATS